MTRLKASDRRRMKSGPSAEMGAWVPDTGETRLDNRATLLRDLGSSLGEPGPRRREKEATKPNHRRHPLQRSCCLQWPGATRSRDTGTVHGKRSGGSGGEMTSCAALSETTVSAKRDCESPEPTGKKVGRCGVGRAPRHRRRDTECRVLTRPWASAPPSPRCRIFKTGGE